MNIPIKDASDTTRKVDVFVRTEGADLVEMQAVVAVDPITGTPIDFANQATAAAAAASGAAVATGVGAQSDSAASTDTGSFSLLAFFKRGLVNWTTLLARIPALVSGRVPVDGSGVTQPVSGTFWQETQPVSGPLTDAQLRATAVPVTAASLPLPAGASTEVTLAAVQALLNTIAGSIQNHNAPFLDGALGQVLLGKRRDSDTTLVADGDLNTLNMDEEGRLKVASKPASYAPTVGSVTSATSTVPVNTERFSNLMVHCTGIFAGANCTFEGSLNSTNGTDGNWFAVQAIRSNANTIETTTGVLAAAPAYAWELSVNALRYFRVRATAWTSGTQVWTMIPGTYATEPIPGAQVSGTQPISGAVTIGSGANAMGSLTAGSQLVGDVGQQYRANATGAATGPHIISAASVNATIVKASAGRFLGANVGNTSAVWQYIKLHNQTTLPTAGTGVVRTIAIPPGGRADFTIEGGVAFATGIGMTIVTGSADADATATTLGAVVGDLFVA